VHDYIVCEDGKAIGRMYGDRRGREQRSPTAWNAPSNPRSPYQTNSAGVGQNTRSLRPLHRGYIYGSAAYAYGASCSRRQINDPARARTGLYH
jgi:hypothetical protein